MANTISNATTGNDILVPTNDNVTYRGLSGDDVYILSSAIAANASISIVDTSGSNRIQLVDGLSITSSRFAADAVELTLSNGAVVTVNGADNFTFEVGGNDTSGVAGTDQTYSQFASAMGVASLPTGSTLTAGTANVSVSGASIGSGTGAGTVSVLTTGYDDMTGGAGNDTYIGTIGTGTTLTANAYDVIDGGDGTDTVTLNLSDGNYSGDTTITNVEVMEFRASGANRTADLLQQAGITKIVNDRSTKDIAVSGIPNVADVFVDRATNGEHTTITYDLLAVFGAGTTANVELNKSGATSNINLYGAAGTSDGIEILNVDTGANASKAAQIIAQDNATDANSTLTNFNVTGSGKLTVTAAIDFKGSAVGALTTGTIDLTGSSGGSLLSATAGENVVWLGGSGNDTINFAAGFTVYDSVDGGDGVDSLWLSGAATFTFATLGAISNVEVVQVEGTAGGGTTIAVGTNTASIYNFVENNNDTQALTVTSLKAGDSVGIIQNNASEPGVVTLGFADASGTSDKLTVTLMGQDGPIALADNGIDDLVITEIEHLDIVSSIYSTTGVLSLASEANIITDLSSDTKLTKITASGNDKLTITSIGAEATKLTDLDMSGMSAATNVTNAAVNALTVTGGSGNDTMHMGTTLNASDTIDLGGQATATTADNLTATIAALTATTGKLNISNVEFVDLNTVTAASVVDASNIVGASKLNVGGTLNVTITNLPVDTIVGVGDLRLAADDDYSGTLTVSLADETGTADQITFQLADGGANDAVDAKLVVNSTIETVNIVGSKGLTDATDDAELNISLLKAPSIVLTGGYALYTEDVDFTNGGSTVAHVNTNSFNVAGYKGTVTASANLSTPTTFTATAIAANTFTGSNKDDTFNINAYQGAATHVLNGGTGNDTLNLYLSASATVSSINNMETINLSIANSAAVVLTNTAAKFINDTEVTTFTVSGGNTLSSLDTGTDAIDDSSLTLIDYSGFEGRMLDLEFGLLADAAGAATALADTTQIKGAKSILDNMTFITDTAATHTPNISGVEYIKFFAETDNTSGSTHTIDLQKADGIVKFTVSTGTGAVNNATFTNYDNAKHGIIELGWDKNGDGTLDAGEEFSNSSASVLTITHASGTGSDDKAAVWLTDTDDSTDTLSITSAGTEILDITLNPTAGAHDVTLTTVTPTTGSKTTVNVKGYGATASASSSLTLATTSSGTTVVNAGAYAGTFTLEDRGTVDMTITGSLGADYIQMERPNDTINVGTGTDTLDVNYSAIIAGISIDLSSTTDQITSFDGSTPTGTVTGFEKVDLTDYTGGFGASITSGSSSTGSYEIQGTKYADSITLGLGTDTIIFNDSDNSVASNAFDVVYNFTAGTDIIQIDASDILTAAAVVAGVTMIGEQSDGSAFDATTTVEEIVSGTAETSAGADGIYILVGTLSADVTVSLESGGNHALTFAANDATDVNDGFLVVYSDGTDGYVSWVYSAIQANAGDVIKAANELAEVKLIKIAGETEITAGEYTGSFAVVA